MSSMRRASSTRTTTSDIWDLHALQAVLLSDVTRLFISLYSTKMRGGYFRFQAQYLRRLHIPHWRNVPGPIRTALARAGKNMDGFIALIQDVIRANGLGDAHMMIGRRLLTLPGFFRPTKLWDLLVINEGRLVAALELKSQVGPSFGNNFNNRTEEALGTAIDLWTAYREGAFGKEAPRPFVGWLILVEDAPESRSAVRDTSPHFEVFPEFRGASYLERYNILCRKLAQERLYTTATVLASPRTAADSGDYADLSELASLKTVKSLAITTP